MCPRSLFCSVCGVLGHLAPVHQCARSVHCFAGAVSWATGLLFTGVPAWFAVLRLRCPGSLGTCSPVHSLGALLCLCGVLGHLVRAQRCARSVCCVACAVSWATCLLFTGVRASSFALLVRCPGQLGSCSPLCPLGALCCACGVLGKLAGVHRGARLVCCVACAVSWATWLLFTVVRAPFFAYACAVFWATWLLFSGVLAGCVVLLVRCPGSLGTCSPVCPLGALLCVCSGLGHLAPVHGCARVVCCVPSAVSWATWLPFTGAPARCVALLVRCPGSLGSCSPVCSLGVLCCLCGVLGHWAPVHRCARSVLCFACVVSWATWLLFTGVPAPSFTLLVRRPRPLGSCSPLCPLGVLCCLCGVLGHLAPVHRCARSVPCFACSVSWATWLLVTGVPTRCVVLLVRCPGPLGSCSPVCRLGALLCVCSGLGHLAPVHGCARVVGCVPSAVSWATWLPFTGAPARWVALLVRCPGPLRSCSPMCPLGLLCCMRGVLGHLPPVHRCARSVCCVACAVSWATWLLFTGVRAPSLALLVRRPGALGSCSPVCPLSALLCVCSGLGHLAPVHGCARVVCCVPSALSWATWLLFTGASARCVALLVRRPGPLGSCSPVCPLGVLCCLCGVLGHWAPVHRAARSVRCFACALSWATWLLFTGVPAWFVVLRLRCPGPLGSCSLVHSLGALLCLCSVLGHLVRAHRCARSVCCVAHPVSWATCLLFTGVCAPSFALLVQCPGPLGSCSPLYRLGALCCACGVLGHVTRIHRGAHSVYCVACAVSRASWLLFTCVPAPSIALLMRCPRPLNSCSPVCPLGVLCCVCGVLGHLPPPHWCARSVLCFACALSWATWLLFTGVPAPSVTLLVRCPRPLGSCSPLCRLSVLCCLCGVLGHLAPVHRCAGSACCVACAVSSATWLLFTGVRAPSLALLVRCPGPLGSCSPVCPLGVLCCLCGVLGHLAPVHRCARSVCFVALAVSLASWLLFTEVPARCVVLRVRCPGPLASCSPRCSLVVPCWVCGVLVHFAPVHRCARSVCYAVGCVRGVESAGRRRGALTRPSGRRLSLAGRGWVPSGRALVHPDGACSMKDTSSPPAPHLRAAGGH